jgi:hypothetical protein
MIDMGQMELEREMGAAFEEQAEERFGIRASRIPEE